MASHSKIADPRPTPRLYLVTPRLPETGAFAALLAEALAAGDVAAVLLRLTDADERTLINRAKALVPITQDQDAALLLDGRTDLVARAGADGVHLGVDRTDRDLRTVPRFAGPRLDLDRPGLCLAGGARAALPR